MEHALFDQDFKYVALKKGEDGFMTAEDITSGIKVANSSGYSAAEEVELVLGRCAKCCIEHVHTGDTAILRNRGAEGGAVYWCRDCYCKEYKEKYGEECSNIEVQASLGTRLGQERYVPQADCG